MASTFTELPGQPGDGAGPSPDGGALSFGGPIEPAPVVTDRTLDEHREIARRHGKAHLLQHWPGPNAMLDSGDLQRGRHAASPVRSFLRCWGRL